MGATGSLHAFNEDRILPSPPSASDSEDDEARGDLRAFIGPNAETYLAAPSRRARWRGVVAGVFAPAAFFLYRRMYAIAAATVLLPWLTLRLFHVQPAPMAAVGFAGRVIYLAIAKRKVDAIRRSTPDTREARRLMKLAGGVDVPAAWLGGVIVVALGLSLGALRGHLPVTGAATPAAPQPGWPLMALLLALLPGAALAAVLLRAGAGRIAAPTFATMVALGAMVANVPGALSLFEAVLRPRMSPMQDALVTSFVFAGLFEEGAKLWMAAVVVPRLVGPRNATGIVVATAGVALGFALLENVNVVIGQAQWERIALTRSLFAVPAHTLVGVYLGRGIASAWRRTGTKRVAQLASTLVVAAFLHGLYDFPLLAGAHAPLVPTPVAQIASSFPMQPLELLGWVLTTAITALCLTALRSAPTGRRDAGFQRYAPSRTIQLIDAFAVALGAGATALCVLAFEGRAIGADVLLNLACVDAAFTLVGVAGVAWIASGSPRRTAILATTSFAAGLLVTLGVHMAFDPARRSLLAEMLVETGKIAAGQADLQRAQSAFTGALALNRSNAMLLLRAEVETMRHRYAEAIADLDRAIAASGGDADLFVRRAQTRGLVHDGAGALADADRAAALAPKSTAPLIARSTVHLDLGDTAAADADVAAASPLAQKGDIPVLLMRAEVARAKGDGSAARVALDQAVHDAPGSADAWGARGRLRFDQGDPKGAADDLAHAAGLGGDSYTLLWLYLARSRTGGGAAREFATLATRIDHRDWPGPIFELYLGTGTARSAMAAPHDADQRCEASFYVGEWLIAQGLGHVAPSLLATAAKACPPSFFEHHGAIAELARIQASEAARHTSPPAAAPASQGASAATPMVAAGATAMATVGATAAATAATKATATLKGDRCDEEGTATWRSVSADAARLLPPSLSVTASLPRSAIEFRLGFGPGDFSDRASAIQVVLGVPQLPGDAAIRSVMNVSIESGSGSRAIRLGAPPINTVGGLFKASEDRADARADLGALGQGDTLAVGYATKSRRVCTLRITVDAAAASAIRATIAAW